MEAVEKQMSRSNRLVKVRETLRFLCDASVGPGVVHHVESLSEAGKNSEERLQTHGSLLVFFKTNAFLRTVHSRCLPKFNVKTKIFNLILIKCNDHTDSDQCTSN